MSPKRPNSGKRTFFYFTVVLSIAIGAILAALTPSTTAEFIFYQMEDATGKPFEVRVAGTEETRWRSYLAQHASASAGPYSFLSARKVIYWSPYVVSFIRGAFVVWLLYFFLNYAVSVLVVQGFREDLSRRKRPKHQQKRRPQTR
ncbi:MAG: hypothetical protein Q8R76_03880 [Candidatus Omnitrophota bacterium]|nr:hypothetical protein [Candidatus Omnitrophota bacterium]